MTGVTALGTGFATFDWSWSVAFPLREKLFAIHRAAGIVTLVAALVWLARYRSARVGLVDGARRHPLVRLYHLGLAVLAVIVSLCAWVGRALDGRWTELISPLPVYNFVSRPDVPLAHGLLSTHATIAKTLLAGVAIHAAFAAAHWLAKRQGR